MTHILRTITALALCIATAITITSCESKSAVDKYTEKKILIRGNSAEPEGLDPHVVTGVTESNIIRALFEGLCVEDPNDDTKSLPGAAASWRHDKEYKIWDFQLQPEGKWSDGKRVTAEDFVFSYHRILNPTFGAKYASMLFFIKGAEDYHKNHRELYLIKPQHSGFNWQLLKNINYRGNSDIDIDDIEKDLFDDLNHEQKKRRLNRIGLNLFSKQQLRALLSDLSLFTWPDTPIPDGIKKALVQTYLDNHDKDMWSRANVGVTAVTPQHLKISLRYPTPFLTDITKHYTWYPVPKHAIAKYCDLMTQEKNYLWIQPGALVSNGPFKLKYWKMNDKITVTRNPYYWDESNVKLNGIQFLPISNAYTEARMFFDNQLHVTDKLAAELIQYSKEKYPKNLRQEPYLGTNFIRLNNNDHVFDDINLRKALAYSLNSQSIITNILKGGQTVATGIVPPMGQYKPAHAFEFNVAKAKEFFKKTKFADHPEQLTLNLVTTDQESAKLIAEAMQSMWKTHLGINIDIHQYDWKSYLSKVSTFQYQIATGGWIGDYPDPTTFLDIWKKGDGNNRTGWSSEAFEAKLKEAAVAADPATRIELLQQAEKILLNDLPIIPLFWYTSNYLVHQDVKGWRPSLMKNQPYKFLDLQRDAAAQQPNKK